MNTGSPIALTFLSFLLAVSPSLSACRYTVRDMGFVDLGDKPYILFALVNGTTAEIAMSTIDEAEQDTLMEANIRAEIVNIDVQKDYPVAKHISSPAAFSRLPVLILYSPEGRFLKLPELNPAQPVRQALRSVLGSVSSSPKRREIMEKVSRSLGVVLVIEGSDGLENKKVVRTAEAAIDVITSLMETLPKTVSGPPELVMLEQRDFGEEKILLWSLGLEMEEADQPVAVVLYGRARLLGPVLKGEDITERRLTNLLGIVGADCECVLDRAWLQNPTLPVRWEEEQEAKLVEELGFDPENPMVKIEMHDILRRGLNSGGTQPDPDRIDVLYPGYTEVDVISDNLIEPLIGLDLGDPLPSIGGAEEDTVASADRSPVHSESSVFDSDAGILPAQPESIPVQAGKDSAVPALTIDRVAEVGESRKASTRGYRSSFLSETALLLVLSGIVIIIVGAGIVLRASWKKR